MIKTTRSLNLASGFFLTSMLLFGISEPSHAQSISSPQINPFPTGGTGAAPQLNGCDSQVMAPAMNQAGAYTYTQSYNTSYGLIHQPTSFLSCLQPMINAANSVVNAFNGSLSISSILSGLLSQAIQSLLTNLANTACAAVNTALAGTGASSGILSYLNNAKGYPGLH